MTIELLRVEEKSSYYSGETTVHASDAVEVGVGNLIVVIAALNRATSQSCTITDSAGNSYTHLDNFTGNAGHHRIAYAICTSGSASNVVTATWDAALTGVRREITVAVFSKASGDVWEYTDYAIDSSTWGTSISTANVDTTRSDSLAIGVVCRIVSMVTNDPLINGQTPTQLDTAINNEDIYYLLMGAVTGFNFTATGASTQHLGGMLVTFGAYPSTAPSRRALDGPLYGSLRGSVR